MDNRRSYGSGIGMAAGVLFAIYLLLPVVFIIPIFAAMERKWIAQENFERIELVFRPLFWLGQAFPPYLKMLEQEEEVCRRHGLLPTWE